MKLTKALVVATVLCAGAGATQAAQIFTVDADYDPFITANTTITIANVSGATETSVDLFSGGVEHDLGSLAAGQSVSYEFNDPTGPFINGAANTGLPDTTTYQVSVSYAGATVDSNTFSPLANLTGGYVDFLGTCWSDAAGSCPDASAPDGGTVAQGVVPLPASLLLLLSGCGGLFGFSRAAQRRA